MTTGWSFFVALLVVANIVGCVWLLFANRTARIEAGGARKGETMGHDFDGIEELNNPLPAWWSWLFVVTVVFGVGYLFLYPGLGRYTGSLEWSSSGQYEAEVARADAMYGPIYAAYKSQPIPSLLGDERAVGMGARLFANQCSTCHGSDARGNEGYPNLTDDDWLYGGAPDQIVQTITWGRIGNMPALGAAMSDSQVEDLVDYTLSLSGRDHDAGRAAAGATVFAGLCAACHGADGTGMQVVGAPNLTDDIWLHGGRRSDIESQIRAGRINQMPAHQKILSPEKIHMLALYVYSLSNEP